MLNFKKGLFFVIYISENLQSRFLGIWEKINNFSKSSNFLNYCQMWRKLKCKLCPRCSSTIYYIYVLTTSIKIFFEFYYPFKYLKPNHTWTKKSFKICLPVRIGACLHIKSSTVVWTNLSRSFRFCVETAQWLAQFVKERKTP